MNIGKRFIIVCVFMLFIIVGFSIESLAITYKEMDTRLGVELNKEWVIKFNQELDLSSINTENIVVLNEAGLQVNIKVLSKDNKTVAVTPVDRYEPGKTYTLIVKEVVQSKSGNSMNLPTRMEFTTEVTAPDPVDSKKYIVALDAGHGGTDPGAVGPNGTKEKDVTLAVTLKLGAILQENGIEVVYTRKNDTDSWLNDISTRLKTRVDIANNSNVDYFVSIHANSYTQSSVSGIETWYYYVSDRGKVLADNIQDELIEEFTFTNRGIRSSEGLYVLKYTNAPAVLVELEFISNTEKEVILKDPVYQQRYAEAIANGIMKTIGI